MVGRSRETRNNSLRHVACLFRLHRLIMDDLDDLLPEEEQDELTRLAQETIESQMGVVDAADIRRRCGRVLDMYSAGELHDSRDHFHAALVLLYGEKPSHFDLARLLAYQSARMGDSRAWSLYAMAWDRWLLALGKPQRFGTQIIRQQGRWSVGALDERTTDNERAFYGVPPLFVQQQRARQLQYQEEQDD